MNSSRGFTIIEIALVMVILGIMAALALIKYNDSLAHQKLETTANNLYMELRSARSLSFKWDAPVIVKFYPALCSIYVDTNGNGRDAADIRSVFRISTPVSIGLPSSPPSNWPDSKWNPVQGLGDKWKQELIITPNTRGEYCDGALYLSTSRLNEATYCIGISASMQSIQLYKREGASWRML